MREMVSWLRDGEQIARGDEREKVAETVEVAGEGVGVGEEEVGEADRLGALRPWKTCYQSLLSIRKREDEETGRARRRT
jgi:hypothetical protein